MHKSPLDRIKVASPCHSEWRWMYGNDRVRFCGQCNLNVYNLSAMTREQAEDLIRRTEGQLCVRFYRRADGTVITKDCPQGLRAIKKKLSHVSAVIATTLLSFLFNIGLLRWIDKGSFATGAISLFIKANPVTVTETGLLVEPFVQLPESFIREHAVFKAIPVYQSSNRRHVRGDAVVKVLINQNGEIERATMIKGNPALKEVVEDAAKTWAFKPNLAGGYGMVESQLTFHFGR